MKLDDEQSQLAVAATPIFERIRSDQETASAQVKPLLKYLEAHLFAPELYVDNWMRVCGVNDHLVTARFHKEMGLGPAGYVRDCRLHTAARLLRDTSLSLSTIGQMIGYSGRKSFLVAFEGWSSEPPTIYRRNARVRVATYGQPPEWMISTPFLQRLAAGLATDEETLAVKHRLQHLIEVKSDQDQHDESHCAEEENEQFEQWMASILWKKIKSLSLPEKRFHVVNQVGYRTMALRDFLLRKSEEVNGLDRFTLTEFFLFDPHLSRHPFQLHCVLKRNIFLKAKCVISTRNPEGPGT